MADDYVRNTPKGDLADELMLKKGDLLMTMNRPADAIQAYEQLARQYPESENAPVALYQVAQVVISQGDTARARSAYENLSRTYPDHDIGVQASLELGRMALDAGSPDEALERFAAVEAARGNTQAGWEASLLKGTVLMRFGRTEEGLKTLRELVSRQPANIMAQRARLELAEYALTQTDYDEAVTLSEEVIEHAVDDNAAHAQYLIGRRWFLAGDYDRALRELMRVPIIYKSYGEWVARAQLLVAQCQRAQGDTSAAEKTLKEVLDLHPRDSFGDEARRLLEAR
jgi:TolA-binding protein